jgi:hypothetical protein
MRRASLFRQISCVLLCPLDVACTVVFSQSASGAVGGVAARVETLGTQSNRVYASPLDCASHILARDGVRGLYRGLGASLLRMVPHTGVTFLLAEVLRGSMRGAVRQTSPPPPVENTPSCKWQVSERVSRTLLQYTAPQAAAAAPHALFGGSALALY